MHKIKKHSAAILVLFTLTSCAAGPNTAENTAAVNGDIAGFWLGLWHGIILPFTFVISLFNDTLNFYEIHNTGATYNLGFVLGVAILFGGSSRS